MRICHVSPHLPPDQAANALLPAELGAWQRARGDDVRFVTHAPAQGGTAGTADASMSIARIPRRLPGGVRRWLRADAIGIVRAVDAALSSAPLDLVHLHSNGLIIESAARWARRAGVPCVLTLYGTEIWHYRPKRLLDLFTAAYRGAAVVTFYSRRLADRARELGLDRPNLVTIYPPVDERFARVDDATREAWRHTLGIREPHAILNVKRLHPLARQDVLIDAFAMIARDRTDVRLIICGAGGERDALGTRARAAGIDDRVTFAGLVPNDLVARYDAVASVFALPSRLEALPTVAVEALACGTPVVSADHPGGLELNEIFGDDVAAVPRENAAALATALTEALARPRRTRPATAASIDRLFRPPAILAAYDSVYATAGKRTSQAPPAQHR